MAVNVYNGKLTREEGIRKLGRLAKRMGIKPADIKVRAAGGGGVWLGFTVQGVELGRECRSQETTDKNLACLVLWLEDMVLSVERGVESFREAFFIAGADRMIEGDKKGSPIKSRPYKGSKTEKDSIRVLERSIVRLGLTRDDVQVTWAGNPPRAKLQLSIGATRVEKVITGQESGKANLAVLALWLQTRAKNFERGIEQDLKKLFAANLLPAPRPQ